MKGKIIRGIAGFYYVHVENEGTYECKAKGIFRNKNIKPLVGDDVELEVLDAEGRLGNIADICERKNTLIRPAVSNVDQAVIVFALAEPEPNFNLLDRFLVLMQQQGVPVIICFNKKDLVDEAKAERVMKIYEKSGNRVVVISSKKSEGTEQLKELLYGKTTVFAGPSGVGKSSTINLCQNELVMQTGEISEKIKRGKHTTRHSEFIFADKGTYIMDTPGFSSLYLEGIEADELKNYYPEFSEYEDLCRFRGCIHYNEPDCAVKNAVAEKKIDRRRYSNYKLIYDELKSKKKY